MHHIRIKSFIEQCEDTEKYDELFNCVIKYKDLVSSDGSLEIANLQDLRTNCKRLIEGFEIDLRNFIEQYSIQNVSFRY